MTRKSISIVIAILFFAALGGIILSKQLPNKNNTDLNIQGMVIPTATPVNPFSLTGNNNKKFTEQNLIGKWSVLFFGFTSCPEFCPTTLSTMAKVTSKLKEQSDKPIQTVFISVDPDRDTPKRVQEYAKYFNPDFIGLTGGEQQLKNLAQQFGVPYFVQKPDKTHPDYTVDHGSMLIVVNPRGQFHAVLSAPHQVEKLAKDIVTLENNFA